MDVRGSVLGCRTAMLKTKRVRLAGDDAQRDLKEVAFSCYKMGQMVFRCPRPTTWMLRGSDWYRRCSNRLQTSEVVRHLRKTRLELVNQLRCGRHRAVV